MLASLMWKAMFLTIAFGAAGSSQPPPAFEVASIKPSAPQEFGRDSRRMSTTPGMLVYTHVSLRDLIQQAYTVQRSQISGPPWLDTERFDITARIPAHPGRRQLPAMMQALLADRFLLRLHSETRELSAYAIRVAKGGPKLEKALSETGIRNSSRNARAHANGTLTMASLAEFLSRGLDKPVIDRTGLDGSYKVALDWATDALENASSGPSIFTAVQEQLGLRLTAVKAPVNILIVDRVEKAATEN
jgi:uncharacterized protein (TIGR03435 family)